MAQQPAVEWNKPLQAEDPDQVAEAVPGQCVSDLPVPISVARLTRLGTSLQRQAPARPWTASGIKLSDLAPMSSDNGSAAHQ